MTKERNIERIHELIEFINSNLREETVGSISSTYLKEEFENKYNKKLGELYFTTNDTIMQAMSCNEKIAILNFASAWCPGGGVLSGMTAQEEEICRNSNLYVVLDYWQKDNPGRFYKTSKQPIYSDKLLYSPEILVIGTDNHIYKTVDVITCAAPNQRHHTLINTEEIIYNRTLNIIESAIDNHVNNLVLGAWGTGVFKNPTKQVAKGMVRAAKEYAGWFNKIIFAIPDESKLNIFKNVL